ncbi:hypothetical protein HIM_05076 [Hirsutella minnesotensis 3608]|uniref:Mitochondrial dicarboxylate transporter n=1 Tax=Hirsutella minnesotensis 3608 TaxID=1043627 RepID=A0A0F7ZUX3_9HYPO|nr:hypothetical protein HIM_05076 [Hirsutella minnesotensis 3608]
MRQGNAPRTMTGTFMHIIRNDGPLALYNGISASLLRQLTYSTVRFGIYEELKARWTQRHGQPDSSSRAEPSFPVLLGMAVTSGGWLPNSSRAAVMTAGQLATYDTFKRLLIDYTPLGDTPTTHFSASFLAGLAAATATSPIDVIKTRVMSSTQNHGVVRLVGDIYKADGIGWMFKGWVPSFLRLGPHTICTFVFLEMHRKAYRRVKGLDDRKL